MELVTEPDLYSPSVDEIGNYIDKIPTFNNINHGLRCPCSYKLYESSSNFSKHIKTKNHQKWLTQLNLNKVNYYIENEKLNETIKNQRLIIAKLEKDMNNKIMTIDYLTQQINNKQNQNHVTVGNLLDFD